MERDVKKSTVAIMRAQGKSFTEIGDTIGVSRQRASQIANEEEVFDEIKDLIEKQTKRLVKDSLRQSVDNIVNEVNRYDTEGEVEDRALALKYSEKVLENTGIFRDRSSITINNILNNSGTIISPVILKLMKDFTDRIHEIKDED